MALQLLLPLHCLPPLLILLLLLLLLSLRGMVSAVDRQQQVKRGAPLAVPLV